MTMLEKTLESGSDETSDASIINHSLLRHARLYGDPSGLSDFRPSGVLR